MQSLIRTVILNPIIAKLFLLFVFIFGLVGLKNMNSNFFTPIEPNFMRIVMTYPGASALEIEDSILIKIENNLRGIPGIDQVTSTAQENSGFVLIEFEKGTDIDDVVENVKNAVNRINTFPKNAEKPIIYKEPSTDPAATLNLMGNLSLIELKDLALKIQQDLTDIDGVSLVKLIGIPEEEIQVKLSQKTLESYKLTLEDINVAINNQNIDLTAGTIETNLNTYTIRHRQKESSTRKIESIVIQSSDNHILRLGDIASVTSGWSDTGELNYFNNVRSIEIQINKTMNEDLLEMIKSIKMYIQNINESLTNTELKLTSDRSVVLKQRIGLLTKNGLIGFGLIMLCLTLFISFRISFWVALSIPISFLGLFFVGSLLDITINVISLFGMIVVIGILVDDGIIIAENIYQQKEKGEKPLHAAVKGVLEVTPSIVAAITTTIIAFSPFFFLDGFSSKIMSDIALVVIVTLLVSLIEGLFLLPAHLVHSNALNESKPNIIKKQFNKIEKSVKGVFERLLIWSLAHKIIVIFVSISLLIATFVALKVGIIKQTFFPYIDSDQTNISVTMPAGIRQQETLRVLNEIESIIPVVNDQFKEKRKDGKDIILSVSKTVEKVGSKGTLNIEFLDGETRKTESVEISNALRTAVGEVNGVESITYGSRQIFGKPIVLSIRGNNLRELNQMKEQIKEKLQNYSRVKDVQDQSAVGAPELSIEFSENISMLGLTPSLIMTQIRNGFFGLDMQVVQRGINEVTIRSELKDNEKNNLAQLNQFMIKTNNGHYIPLGSVATFNMIKGTQKITRTNGQRQVTIEANLANAKDSVPEIISDIKSSIVEPLMDQYLSVNVVFEGQNREQEKMKKSMPVVMSITMIAMFATISAGFGSFSQALLVILILPFGFIGVVWGHKLHGMPLSIMSTYGIIALVGIIVNDSIVLVNTYNRYLLSGLKLNQAIVRASVARFRPIILTSITTIAGLGPLILEKSRQAQFLIPMAISITYGLLIATFFILVLLPIFIVTLNKLRYFIFSKILKKDILPESLEPSLKRLELQKNVQ